MRDWETVISRAFFSVVLGGLFCASLPAQESKGSVSRWAIIAADEKAIPLADLLTAELSGSSNIQLVEREQILKVLEELNLNAGGLVQRERATRFGKLSHADALVIINTSLEKTSNKPSLRVRLIDTRTSVRLLDTVLSSSNLDADVVLLRDELQTKNATLAIPSKQLRLISVAAIMSGEPGYLLRPYCKTLTALVASDFHRRPEFIVLERDDLQRLTAESDLNGIELELRGATRLLETSVRRSEDNQGVIASCRIASPAKGEKQSFDVRIASRDIAQVRSGIVARVLESIGDRAGDYKPASPEQEAQSFDRRSGQFARSYRPQEAVEMAEAAYALFPTKDRLDWVLLQAGSLARHHLRNNNRLAALLAARRENELLLKTASQYPGVQLARNPASNERYAPPLPMLPYGNSLVAETADEKQILADINTFRRQISDVRLAQAGGNPLLQFRVLLTRVDLELDEVQHDPYSVDTVTDLLRGLFSLTQPAGIERDLRDAYYRALMGRMVATIGKVHQAGSGSAWKVDNYEQWTQQLGTLDARCGMAARLLSETKRAGASGERAAAELLAMLDEFPHIEPEIDVVDKVLRLPALQGVSTTEANQYAEKLVARVEAKDDPAELLDHSYSVAAFFRGLSQASSQRLASRILDMVRKVESPLALKPGRIRAALLPYSVVKVDPPTELSLVEAPGPWQDYVVHPIRLTGFDKYPFLWKIYVDRRGDAAERGGELVLVRGLRRTLSIERVSLSGGKPHRIGPDIQRPGSIDKVQIAVGPDAMYIATTDFGFTKLTGDSAERFTEAEGAASDDIWGLAWWKDRLYIAYRDALGSFDPATKRFELFASSTSVEAKNPFDARGSFFVGDLIPDETYGCLWMTIQDNGPDRKRNGLWKWVPDKNEYQNIVGSAVEISPDDDGFLVNRSAEPRVAWLERESAKLDIMLEFSHASSSRSLLDKPTPHLIKMNEHLIGDNGTLMTNDGKTFSVPGEHHWDLLQRVGNGFITHYDHNQQTIWYIKPKS